MANEIITQKRLKELFEYSPDTGDFIRRVSVNKRFKVGTIAGCVDNSLNGGYNRIKIDGRLYRAHRLAFLYMTGEMPKDQVDHINHIRTDNRWKNLVASTKLENSRNQSKHITNTSGHTGVYWRKDIGKWMAFIRIDGKPKSLGRFNDINDAAAARKKAELELGYHINHGC